MTTPADVATAMPGMEITDLLVFTQKNNASDLHLSTGSPPILRINGDIMHFKLPVLSSNDVKTMLYSIMNEQQRSEYEREMELDFAALGFDDDVTAAIRDLLGRPFGILLVTGPTGSGKTTTLYSTLKRLATDEVNVCTIEDPIEMIEPAFNQTQTQNALDFGFAEGLRALMRQDPDIIMVGEIRDLPTAEMAIQAALTGHLVFSTLHTNDAASAITRLADLGVPTYLINATVIGVLAQRLVRTLCPQCKQPDPTVTRESLNDMLKPWRMNGGVKPCKPVGCLECRNTGFRGRAGLYELLTLSEAIKSHLHPTTDMSALRRQAMQEGLRPLRLAGAMKVAEGVTTLDEVFRSTPQWES